MRVPTPQGAQKFLSLRDPAEFGWATLRSGGIFMTAVLYAELAFYGDDLIPRQVTEILNVRPTKS